MKSIINIEKPSIVISDLGSEFISKEFKKLMKDNDIKIQYCKVGDHHALGIIDRAVRTIRERINAYQEKYNTLKYIDILPDIIRGYNSTFNNGIKKAPEDVTPNDAQIIAQNMVKYSNAIDEEIKYNINDKVRFLKNLDYFEKRTLPKWSHEIHKIVDIKGNKYILDNGKSYRYNELQIIHNIVENAQPMREQIRKENKSKRNFKKSGLNITDILTTKRINKPVKK